MAEDSRFIANSAVGGAVDGALHPRPRPVYLRHVGVGGLGHKIAAVGLRNEAAAHEARDVLCDLAHVLAVVPIQRIELRLGEWDLVPGDEAERRAGRAARTTCWSERRGTASEGLR